jgi:hypothetical protein
MAYIGNIPQPNPVTTNDIADGAVTTPKLASPIAPTISGGSVNNAPIGATTPNTGVFTTLTATSGISGGTF